MEDTWDHGYLEDIGSLMLGTDATVDIWDMEATAALAMGTPVTDITTVGMVTATTASLVDLQG
jgi:hypothetical protein